MECWHAYGLEMQLLGKFEAFKEDLCNYITITRKQFDDELRAYANNSLGEIMSQEIRIKKGLPALEP